MVELFTGEQWRDSAIFIHVPILPQTPTPFSAMARDVDVDVDVDVDFPLPQIVLLNIFQFQKLLQYHQLRVLQPEEILRAWFTFR